VLGAGYLVLSVASGSESLWLGERDKCREIRVASCGLAKDVSSYELSVKCRGKRVASYGLKGQGSG
jgi:hypothetical protein